MDGNSEVPRRNARGELLSRNKNGYQCVYFRDRNPDFFPLALNTINQVGAELWEGLKLEIFAMSGSLLGPVREGAFIPHDDDFDFCYVSRHDTEDAIAQEALDVAAYLRERGYKVSMACYGFMQITAGGIRFDLFVGWKQNNLFYLYWGIPDGIPVEAVLPLSTMDMYGVPVAVPAAPEEPLVAIYGPDWKTPDPAFRYTKDTRHHRRFDFLVAGWPKETGKRYWNSTYATKPIPTYPSQFAVSVLPELAPQSSILDLGCGNGRDTLFFASRGMQAVGADAASAAVEAGNSLGQEGAHFEQLDLYRPRSLEPFIAKYRGQFDVVYARFFIHAIDAGGEASFWHIAKTCLKAGGKVYIETRTAADLVNHAGTLISPNESITDHYRRFVVATDLHARARGAGFKVTYEVEGRGMAKYKSEDPDVLRVIYEIEAG
jgi:SAM-dependent methyltransferase